MIILASLVSVFVLSSHNTTSSALTSNTLERNSSVSKPATSVESHSSSSSVAVSSSQGIDYGKVTSTLNVGIHPSWITYNQKENLIYVTGDNKLVIIDPSNNNSVVKVLSLSDYYVGQPIVDSLSGLVYVPTFSSIVEISKTQMIANITKGYAGTTGWGTFDPDNQAIYIATSRMKPSYIAIQILNTQSNSIVTNISSPSQLGLSIMQLLYDSQSKLLYVVSYGSYGIAILNTSSNQLVTSLQIGSAEHGVANAIAWDPANDLMYVSDWGDNQTILFSANDNSIVTRIASAFPIMSNFDPYNGLVYVTNAKWDSVQVINGTELVGSIHITGNFPWGLAFDSENNHIYVTNFDSMTISVISSS